MMATLSGTTGFSGNFQPEPTGKKAVEGPGRFNYAHDINSELYPQARSLKETMLKQLDRNEKINARRAMVDRRMTAFANDLGIADMAAAEFKAMSKDIEEMGRMATGLVNNAKANLAAKAGVSAGPNAREIRDRLVAMSHEDRLNAIREAAANGDRETLGAVVGLSKLMTGIDPAIVQPLFDDYQRRTAPVEWRALADAAKYAGYVDALPRDAHAWYVRSVNGTEASASAQRAFDAIFNNPADKADPEPEAE